MKCFLSCKGESLKIEIIKASYTKTEVFYSNLNQADNSTRFNVVFTIELANFLKIHINDDVKAEIFNNNLSEVLFTGYLRKNQNFQKTQRNLPISLEIVSPSYFLNKNSIRGRGYVNKSLSFIITDLLNEAGFTDIGDLSALSFVPMVLVFNSGDNYKTVITEILHEYGYVFDFDNRGFFQIFPIFNIPVKESIEQLFNGLNSLSKIEIIAKEQTADSVSAEWKKITKHLNTLIFKDTTSADDTHDCKQPILAGEFFANEEFNYLDCDSEFGDVVFIENVYPDVKADSSLITWEISATDLAPDRLGEVLGKQLCFKAYNPDGTEHNLIKIQANGDVYTSENLVEVRSFGTKNRKNIDLKYIYDQTHAETYVENYTNWLRYATDLIKLESTTDYALGSFVKIEDYGIGTYYGRILKKSTSLKNDVIQYEIETITEFTPATMDYKQNPSAGKISQSSIDAAIKQSKDYTDESITSVVVDVASRWEIRPNTFILRKNGEGTLESDLVTAEAIQITGDIDSRPYAGYWKNTVTFTDGTSRVIYDGEAPEEVYSYHAPENTSKITLELYTKKSTDPKTVMLDRQFVQVVKDGTEGLLVFLNDTFQTYKADSRGILKDVPEFTTKVSCYIGSEEADCVIDVARMKQLNGVIRGLEYGVGLPNTLKVQPLNGDELTMGGTIIVPVVVDSSAFSLYNYGYADENGRVYAGADIEPGSNTILLKWNWQKLNILEATTDVINENSPKYLGKVYSYETIPPVGKNGDYFLYAGEESTLHNFKIGHVFLYQDGNWIEKSTTSIKEMDDVFNDMISIVDISDGDAPMVTIVNRLVTSEAFIDKLATRIISLQNGGVIKSENFNGNISEDSSRNMLIDFSNKGTSGFAIDTLGNGMFCGNLEIRGETTIGQKATFEGQIFSGPLELSNVDEEPVIHTYTIGYSVAQFLRDEGISLSITGQRTIMLEYSYNGGSHQLSFTINIQYNFQREGYNYTVIFKTDNGDKKYYWANYEEWYTPQNPNLEDTLEIFVDNYTKKMKFNGIPQSKPTESNVVYVENGILKLS